MNRFLLGTRAECDAYSAAINLDAGCPIRPTGYGTEVSETPGPGWTMTVLYDVLEVDASTAVLEIPEDQLQHLGIDGVPALEATVIDTDLPPALLTLVRFRRGQDADGNPLPFE
jgi:hypothetical protein